MLPGFNANHCAAMRSYATEHAVEAGFGKGEFAAAVAILRGLSVMLPHQFIRLHIVIKKIE